MKLVRKWKKKKLRVTKLSEVPELIRTISISKDLQSLNVEESMDKQKANPSRHTTFRGRPVKDTLKVLTSGTSRGPSGDSQGTNKKNDSLMKKSVFQMQQFLFYSSVTVFYWKNKYAKVLNGTSTGCLRDPVAGRPEDQMMGRSGYDPGTQVIHVF